MLPTNFPRIRRTRRILSVLAVLCTLLTAACGLGSSDSSSSKVLTIATWKGYGADLDWALAAFEKSSGATVRFQYVDSESSMLQVVRNAGGKVDVALPNLQYLKSFVDAGVLQPLDTSKLHDYANLFPPLADRPELRNSGKLYGLPWAWGSTALFYDSRTFTTEPSSYDVLWDPAYQGKIALLDDPTVLVPITAMYVHEDPQNPDMTKVEPALARLKANAKMLYSSNDELAKAVANGSVVAGIGNSSDIGGIAASGVSTLRYTVPTAGGVGWVDNWAITAKTSKASLAYQWLNFMTSRQFLVRWANNPDEGAPAPANSAAVDALDAAARQRLQVDPSKIAALALQVPQPAARLQSWVTAWQDAKAH